MTSRSKHLADLRCSPSMDTIVTASTPVGWRYVKPVPMTEALHNAIQLTLPEEDRIPW